MDRLKERQKIGTLDRKMNREIERWAEKQMREGVDIKTHRQNREKQTER